MVIAKAATSKFVNLPGLPKCLDGKPAATSAGDDAYFLAKGVHPFTAVSAVLISDLPTAAFDIHYVDGSGAEITPEQALGSTTKKSAEKFSTKQ